MGLGHHHDHHDHDHHGHGHGASTTRAFAVVTLINLAYTALEAGYGFTTNSLALLSDALHNLGDVLGLALAWGAAVIAKRPPTARHTYGWRRATSSNGPPASRTSTVTWDSPASPFNLLR